MRHSPNFQASGLWAQAAHYCPKLFAETGYWISYSLLPLRPFSAAQVSASLSGLITDPSAQPYPCPVTAKNLIPACLAFRQIKLDIPVLRYLWVL